MQVIETKAQSIENSRSTIRSTIKVAAGPFFEVLTAEEWAQRWRVGVVGFS